MNTSLRPSFMIIGAQKAGTTALFEYLCLHPAIAPPVMKEIDFFNCDGRYGLGLDFYHRHFPAAGDADQPRYTFDATPGYLATPAAAERVHRYDANMRLVVVMRDPVARAYSAWQMYSKRLREGDVDWYRRWMQRCNPGACTDYRRRGGPFAESFEFAVFEELAYRRLGVQVESPILLHGRYHEQLRNWLEWFPASQMLLISSAQLHANTAQALERIESFAGLPRFDWSTADLSPRFVGDYREAIPAQAQRALRGFYADVAPELNNLTGQVLRW